ncbi:MAG TPA: carbohydrate kinase family protein [Acidobacteriaceae bacterium]|nr:carbohydrate kinase family protein [Acidobacteriaceae bacterium]
MDIVGVGLNATDTLIPLSRYPASGSKVEFRSASVLPGGQVASAMVACARWGLRARYVGKLGDDDAAELHRGEFAAAGVEAKIIAAPGCMSQQAFIMVEDSGERTVLWKRDDHLALQPDDLRQEWFTDARAVHLDGHDTEAAIAAAGWARQAGIAVLADLDELYPGVEQLIEKVDYLIVSRDIPSRLAARHDLRESLVRIQQRFGCRLTSATLGRDGVLAWDGHEFCYRPAYQVDVVDTTGAGDIFHAGFIYGLLQGWPLELTLDFACAAAALNCTASGARGGIQPVSHIQDLMATGSRHPFDPDSIQASPNDPLIAR